MFGAPTPHEDDVQMQFGPTMEHFERFMAEERRDQVRFRHGTTTGSWCQICNVVLLGASGLDD